MLKCLLCIKKLGVKELDEVPVVVSIKVESIQVEEPMTIQELTEEPVEVEEPMTVEEPVEVEEETDTKDVILIENQEKEE